MTDRRLLEVERVQVHVAVDPTYAGHAGLVAELVGVGWVDHEGALAVLLGKAVDEEAPQLRGVLDPVGAAERVVEHDVIDLVGTALEWHEATAASDEGVDGREIDAPSSRAARMVSLR